MLKWILIVAATLIVAASLFLVWGASLPREHRVQAEFVIPAPPETVFAIIADVAAYPAWRSGVSRVEVLAESPLQWRETTSTGLIVFERLEAEPPRRIVARIADDAQPFGGTWTFELSAETGGEETRVRIIEDGYVDSALFRAMSKLFFDPRATMKRFLSDLAAAADGEIRWLA